MPIKIEMVIQDDGKEGINFDYEASPVDKVTENEQDLASAIIALCNLIDNEEFNEQVGSFIKKEMLKIGSANDLIM